MNVAEKKLARNKCQRERSAKQRTELIEYLGGCCVACSCSEERKLQFDHIDPSIKLLTITDRTGRFSLDKLKIEADKCQLLCEDCHRIRHKISRKGKLVMTPDLYFDYIDRII